MKLGTSKIHVLDVTRLTDLISSTLTRKKTQKQCTCHYKIQRFCQDETTLERSMREVKINGLAVNRTCSSEWENGFAITHFAFTFVDLLPKVRLLDSATVMIFSTCVPPVKHNNTFSRPTWMMCTSSCLLFHPRSMSNFQTSNTTSMSWFGLRFHSLDSTSPAFGPCVWIGHTTRQMDFREGFALTFARL